MGGSAGTAVAAAMKFAQRLETPKYIVALLPDTGRNYLSKIYSDAWMQENGFWEGKQIKLTKLKEIIGKKSFPSLISVGPRDILTNAVKLMHQYNISQIPVIDRGRVVGSLQESTLMKLLHDGIDFTKQEISPVMGKPLPVVNEETDLSEAYRLLLSGTQGIIITRDGLPVGVITRTDLINHWILQRE